jgi:hypothetical protein
MGPRHWLRSFIQLSKIRGAANGKVETSRGRKSQAQRVYVRPAGVSTQAAGSDETRAPKIHYTGRKKGDSGFDYCFHGDTGRHWVLARDMAQNNLRVSGIIAGIK